MSFLDWIANWAEEHIPLVGGWIAELVRKIQSAIEGAYGWLEDAVGWIEDTWIPWAEDVINSLSDSLSAVWDEINDYLEPALEALSDALSEVKDTAENTAQELRQLLNNFREMVWNAIPDWLKEGAEKAIDEIPQLWSSLNSLFDDFSEWINNAGSWFQEQLHNAKDLITSWIHEIADPIEGWINWFKREFNEFLEDPVGYIRKAMDPIISELREEWNEFKDWVDEKTNDLTDAVLSIDDYLLKALESFIISLIVYFIATFIDDLAHLQYDPETKQIYGKPKNPITHILIWFFEVEKPENPYQSVKDRMGVKEVRGFGYGGP